MFGIYIHVPFCKKKCFYCDFYSVTKTDLIDTFVDSLCKEIEIASRENNIINRSVSSIFFGGGTPSLLTSNHFASIINALHKYYIFDDNIEFSIEVNPGTIDKQKLIDYKELGINRISIGVQSFIDKELKFLQRIHNSEQALEAIDIAHNAGFNNISIDLIYGIPEQTVDDCLKSISIASNLRIEHISAYNLIYEPDTPLYNDFQNKKLIKIDENSEVIMFKGIDRILNDNDFEHYEISNYAKHGKQCRHNINYWERGEYIGFGPSAHSYIHNDLIPQRFANVKNIYKYNNLLKQDILPVDFKEVLTNDNIIDEEIYLSLRYNGINIENFNNKYNLDIINIIKKNFPEDIINQYFDIKNNIIKLTIDGLLVSDGIALKMIMNINQLS